MSEHLSELNVVGAHEGGVFVAVGFTVEEHHRNAFVVCLADDVGEVDG